MVDRDVLEETSVLQPELADLHQHRAEDIAGTEHQLAEDDRALGLGVALDDDRFDAELLALVHDVFHVDRAGRDVWLAVQTNARVEVAVLAVEVIQPLHVLVELGGHEHDAGLLAHDPLQEGGIEKLVPGEGHLAHPVLAALVDLDDQFKPLAAGIVELDLVLRDVDVEEPELPVEVAQLVEVILELVILEATGAGEPGEQPPFLGFHRPAQFAGGHRLVADELDVGDFDLLAFLDLEDDGAEAAHAVALHGVVDRDLVVAGLLVILPELLGVLLDLALVEGLVRLHLHLFLEAGGFHLHVALKTDGKHAELGGHLDDQVEGLGVDLLLLDLDEFEEAGAVEGADIAVEDHLIKLAPLPDLHVGAHHLLVDVGGADELDRERSDLEGGRLQLALRRRGRQLGRDRGQSGQDAQQQRDKTAKEPAGGVTGESFQSV